MRRSVAAGFEMRGLGSWNIRTTSRSSPSTLWGDDDVGARAVPVIDTVIRRHCRSWKFADRRPRRPSQRGPPAAAQEAARSPTEGLSVRSANTWPASPRASSTTSCARPRRRGRGSSIAPATSSITTIVGEAASEAAFKRDAARYRVLNVATHRLFDERAPIYSAFMLSTGRRQRKRVSRSARDREPLSLHRDVAILSACDTARGRDGAGGPCRPPVAPRPLSTSGKPHQRPPRD